MNPLTKLFQSYLIESIPILDKTIIREQYTPLNLSAENSDLVGLKVTEPDVCQSYINAELKRNDAEVAYGGYLENRSLYLDKAEFSRVGESKRTIHLGVDFWTKAGTTVLVPLKGKIHSFKNNDRRGDYGPTIILVHEIAGFRFHTLYGHLSLESLQNLKVGKSFEAGTVLGTLGNKEVNGNYAPHLHFQIIIDMNNWLGDYPGVCAKEDVAFYSENCPDPNLLLNL